MPCPTCDGPRPAKADNPVHPFCSGRCKLIDLSRWLDGAYRIAGTEPAGAELDGTPLEERSWADGGDPC